MADFDLAEASQTLNDSNAEVSFYDGTVGVYDARTGELNIQN